MKPIIKFITCGAVDPKKREEQRLERAKKKLAGIPDDQRAKRYEERVANESPSINLMMRQEEAK